VSSIRLTAADVRAFVVADLADALTENGIDPDAVGDDFDLLTSGVIDSFGILELIADVNEHFGIEIDFEELDPEGLTIVGQFSAYVARMAAPAAA
jgi:acyl carrier protein